MTMSVNCCKIRKNDQVFELSAAIWRFQVSTDEELHNQNFMKSSCLLIHSKLMPLRINSTPLRALFHKQNRQKTITFLNKSPSIVLKGK